MKQTSTYSFGVSRREGHDSSPFYARKFYTAPLNQVFETIPEIVKRALHFHNFTLKKHKTPFEGPDSWWNRVYPHTSENMHHLPSDSVALAFTSPPYGVGKEYDENLNLIEYLELLARVGFEVKRVLKPGGRYVINVAALGRKPYIPLHALLQALHAAIGFLPLGEIIWIKGKAQSGSCAWGSWKSAKAPRLRDVHEYLLVFCKESFSRLEQGESDITREEFLQYTLSVWEVPPESARRVGHPAPFPVELARRVIKLFTYRGDVVLDPFCGSGSTLVAAHLTKRRWVGYEIVPEYCELALRRLHEEAYFNALLKDGPY